MKTYKINNRIVTKEEFDAQVAKNKEIRAQRKENTKHDFALIDRLIADTNYQSTMLSQSVISELLYNYSQGKNCFTYNQEPMTFSDVPTKHELKDIMGFFITKNGVEYSVEKYKIGKNRYGIKAFKKNTQTKNIDNIKFVFTEIPLFDEPKEIKETTETTETIKQNLNTFDKIKNFINNINTTFRDTVNPIRRGNRK